MLLALPEETLPELAPAMMLAVPHERIPAMLPGILKLLPPDVVQDVVSAVVAARWLREQAEFSESGDDMRKASQCLTALHIECANEQLLLFPFKSTSWCDSGAEDFDSGAMLLTASPCDTLASLKFSTDVVQDVVSAVAALPADELPKLAHAMLSFSAAPLPGALKPHKVAFEEFDSGWGTLQMGGMNSAVCSGQLTVERVDPFRPADSAEGQEAPGDLPSS